MKRNGKELPVLRDGHPRRLADGRNAWRKMNDEQRRTFAEFIAQDITPDQLACIEIAVAGRKVA